MSVSESGDLRSRVASGLAWTTGAFGAMQLLGIVQTVVLARLLSPSDFGTYGMVSLAIGTFGVFTSLGINDAVVQSRHEGRATLDSAFCLNLIRGSLLYLVLFTAAPTIERFFANPGVAALIRVAGLTVLLSAAGNVGPLLFTKALDYRRASLWGQFPALISLFASLVFAYWLRSAWAFALSAVTASVLASPLSYWIHPYRPRLRLDREATRHLLRFGVYILCSEPFFYLSNRIDDIVVGRQFGSHVLGAYQVAFATAILPATHVSGVVVSALFPVFAQLQSAPERLRDSYVKTLRHVSSLCLAPSAFLCMFAADFIAVLYGKKWSAAAPLLVCFSLYGGLRAVVGVPVQIFKATGRTRPILELAILNLVAIVFVLLIVAPYGATWIAVMISAISLPFAFYGFDLAGRILGMDVRSMVGACIPSATATAIAAAIVLGCRASLNQFDGALVRLIAGGALFGAIYLPLLVAFDRRWLGEILSLLRALRAPGAERPTLGIAPEASARR